MECAEGNSASMDERLLSHQEQLSRPLDNQILKLHSKEEAAPCNHQVQSDPQIPDPCKQYDVHEIPKKPIKQLTQEERDYWQQRLPRGFQFYLERLARGVIRNQPENIKEFAAGYLEELLVSRNAELWKLPIESYFTKLYKKKTLKSPWQPKRRNVGRSPAEQSPVSATVFPDFVPEENLPISTVANQPVNSVIGTAFSCAYKKEMYQGDMNP
ncbi:unnamed protein product [Lymnaea stagnalis]|uniref:RIIa domain-containing protein n=1 Tax=Lymnaea stagnalis TaxID=6523 RepID=A0AAV2H7C7_LYMST